MKTIWSLTEKITLSSPFFDEFITQQQKRNESKQQLKENLWQELGVEFFEENNELPAFNSNNYVVVRAFFDEYQWRRVLRICSLESSLEPLDELQAIQLAVSLRNYLQIKTKLKENEGIIKNFNKEAVLMAQKKYLNIEWSSVKPGKKTRTIKENH